MRYARSKSISDKTPYTFNANIDTNQFWINNDFDENDSSDEEFSMDRFKTKKNSTRINVRKND